MPYFIPSTTSSSSVPKSRRHPWPESLRGRPYSATEYGRESVELCEARRRRGVKRHDAHDGRLDVWRRPEIVFFFTLHEVVDFGVELYVRGWTRPEHETGLRDQSHREFVLGR